jgi:hypothetical protein
MTWVSGKRDTLSEWDQEKGNGTMKWCAIGAAFLLSGCAAGLAGIREPWERQGTVMADPTCRPAAIEETGSEGGRWAGGPATFLWRATCVDGRVLTCSGTPNRTGGGMATSACR